MVRPRNPAEHDLNRLVEGLLLFDEPLVRYEVVSRIFRNNITSKRLDELLADGQAQGLIVVVQGFRVREIRRPATLISPTDKARGK